LLAAVETCFLVTLGGVAQAWRFEFTSLELSSEGTVDRAGGAIRFTEVVLRPRLTVPPGTDTNRALRLMEKSEKTCLVSASLSTPIRLEPEILQGLDAGDTR